MTTDTPKPKLPCPLLNDKSFVYTNSASTDITKTWRKFGWIPLAELNSPNNPQGDLL